MLFKTKFSLINVIFVPLLFFNVLNIQIASGLGSIESVQEDEFDDIPPLFPLVNNDIAKSYGTWALILLLVATFYIVVKRVYIYIRLIAKKEDKLPESVKEYLPTITKYSQEFYSKTRVPLFYIHLSANILATGFAIVHGLSVEMEGLMMVVSGWVGVFFMFLLSVSGFIMWRKFWPFWEHNKSRKLIRAAHRQWLFSFILLLALAGHLTLFND